MYFPIWRTISYINTIFWWTLLKVAVIASINIKSILCHKTSHRCKNSDPSMLRLSCVCWKDALAAAEEVSLKTPPPSVHFDMRVQNITARTCMTQIGRPSQRATKLSCLQTLPSVTSNPQHQPPAELHQRSRDWPSRSGEGRPSPE